MCKMRTFSGFMIILLLVPIFIFTVFLTVNEWAHTKSFHAVLDEKIKIKNISLPQTSKILDQNGEVTAEISQGEIRYYLEAKEIPLFLKNIFVVSEDRNFYEHPGFDLNAMGRAMAINIKSGGISQGASTITQQLARNVYLNPQKTYNRKLSELLYAYQIERHLSKEKILELYLNAIYFQNGAYGLEAAAREYFNKHIQELTRGEQAFIAAIPNNPSLYDPLKHFQFTKSRQERLLDQMRAAGFISNVELTQIKAEPIHLNLQHKLDLYPDYTDYAEAELKELIKKEEGYDTLLANASGDDIKVVEEKLNRRFEDILHSGITVHTALDTKIQEQAQAAVKRNLPYRDVEGAAVAIRLKDHAVISLVGGKDYQRYNFNRAYQSFRQPGSAIKPLLVYAPFFERTHESLAKKISAAAFCDHGYCPENYGKAKYGNVTLESAFIHSYNTPAVRLLRQVGVNNAFKDLDKFHFQQVTAMDHVLPAAIGGFSVGMSPLEMTSAYTVFGNEGIYQPSHAITSVTDQHGKILYTWKDQETRVWSKETVGKIRALMRQTVLSGTAKKAFIPTSYAGGKTGTTNNYKDYWFIGLTDKMTIGVWVGKDKPESMESFEKKGPHLLIWRDIAKSSLSQ